MIGMATAMQTVVIFNNKARSEFFGDAPHTARAIPKAVAETNPAAVAINFSSDARVYRGENKESSGSGAIPVNTIVQSNELFLRCWNAAAPSDTAHSADTCRKAVQKNFVNAKSFVENSAAMTGIAIPANAHSVAAAVFAQVTFSGETGVVQMMSILPFPFSFFQRLAAEIAIQSWYIPAKR